MINIDNVLNKVCHVTSAHPRYDIRIYHKECVSLAKNGYDVTLIVNDELPNEYTKGIKVVSTGLKPKNRFERLFRSIKEIKKKIIEVDAELYHLHDPELLLLVPFLKKINKKIIFDSHEHYKTQIKEKKYIPKYLRWITTTLYGAFEYVSFKKIDNIIFPCTINKMYPFNHFKNKTVLINNFPRIEEFYDAYKTNPEKGFTVCYTGGISSERGITNAVYATNRSKSKFKIAGRFTSSDYRKEIFSLEESKTVEYLGYLTREEIIKLYSESSIGICTLLNIGQYNNTDNLPTKAYEYMAMGLPVILSVSDYASEINEEYNFAALVNPQDIDEITNKINYLFSNPKILREKGANGRRAIKEKFNWSEEEAKLIKMYNQLCLKT